MVKVRKYSINRLMNIVWGEEKKTEKGQEEEKEENKGIKRVKIKLLMGKRW